MSFKLQRTGRWERSSQRVLSSCSVVKTIVGKANEVVLGINGDKLTVLLDTGSMVSTMAESLCRSMGLTIQPLDRILSIEGAGGHQVPYLGYVEVHLHSQEIELEEFPALIMCTIFLM